MKYNTNNCQSRSGNTSCAYIHLGSLVVDGGSPESKTSPGSSRLLDLALDVYLGGHEDYTLVLKRFLYLPHTFQLQLCFC